MIHATPMFLVLSLCTVLGVVSIRAQHAGDILIGQTVAGGLGATNLPERTIFLSPVTSGTFRGWSSTVLGFDGIVATNGVNALNPLAAGANVHLEVMTIDAGLSLRSFSAPAVVFADEPGEQLRIGGTGSLHNHPLIFIDSAVVGTNFAGRLGVTFRLVDIGTAGLLPSAAYSLSFSPVLPAHLAISRTDVGFTISLGTSAGLAYQLQAAPTPTGPWISEGGAIVGTGGMAQSSVSASSSNRFFRVRSVPDN